MSRLSDPETYEKIGWINPRQIDAASSLLCSARAEGDADIYLNVCFARKEMQVQIIRRPPGRQFILFQAMKAALLSLAGNQTLRVCYSF